MKKNHIVSFLLAVTTVLLFSVLTAISAFAFTVGSGYMKDSNGAETNIKYTVSEDGVVSFEIDSTATDKIQTTTIYAIDPNDGSTGNWDRSLPTFSLAKKMVIGDGITTLNSVMISNGVLTTVEIPASLTHISSTAFESCGRLSTIYIKGSEPVEGTLDLSNITSFGAYCFDGCGSIKAIKLNPNFSGNLPTEFIKNNARLTELEIPAGTKMLQNGSLSRLSKLSTLTIMGSDTVIESINVFAGATVYPAIKAPAGSLAALFAKDNGFTFIDIDTGDVTEGDLPAVGTTSGTSGDGSSGSESSGFKPKDGTTAWGHSTAEYQGFKTVDTYWAYFADTKTLEFTAAGGGYNETGKEDNCDDVTTGWGNYKDVIEHVVVNGGIHKMSNGAFRDMPKLRDVVFAEEGIQCDVNCFTNCVSLVSVRKMGTEEKEGTADATSFAKLNDCFKNSGISEVILPRSTKSLDCAMPINIKTLYAYEFTEELREFCEKNQVNLFAVDGSFEYEYYVEIPDGVTFCGDRAAFLLDEATGVMTVYGSGKIADITNYFGGGSKFSPFVKVKKSVKHLIITDNITSLGKYSFCEFTDLETVELPDSEIDLGIAVFEKCTNLRSVYRRGTAPIEGTADLGKITEINNYAFATDYLIANVIINENVEKIGPSAFEDNLNLSGVYGVAGSYAETFAAENGLSFYDISTNTPAPVKCEPPETSGETTEIVTELVTQTETISATEPEPVTTEYVPTADPATDTNTGVIIAVTAAVIVAAGLTIFIVTKKRKTKQ